MGNARRQKELKRARRKKRDAARQMRPRACGGCTECCTHQEIPEVPTPMGETCVHDFSEGCSIYEIRPDRCKKFACLWHRGWGEKGPDRPDKLGWFAAVVQRPKFNTAAGGGSRQGAIIVVRETRLDACEESRCVEAVAAWVAKGSAVLVQRNMQTDDEQLTLYGPRIPRGVSLSKRDAEKDPTEDSSSG